MKRSTTRLQTAKFSTTMSRKSRKRAQSASHTAKSPKTFAHDRKSRTQMMKLMANQVKSLTFHYYLSCSHENVPSTGKSKGITDGELKNLKARIDNGGQMLDNCTLENLRKKIIDELGRKHEARNERKQPNDSQNYRFDRQQQRGGFRRNNNDQSRRNNFHNNRGGSKRMSFPERNRNNINRNQNK